MSRPLKGLAAVLLAAAILYGMQRTMPYYGEITAPIVVEGKAGERVDADAFALGIVNVHLARTLDTESFGKSHSYTTSGVWVVVVATSDACALERLRAAEVATAIAEAFRDQGKSVLLVMSRCLSCSMEVSPIPVYTTVV